MSSKVTVTYTATLGTDEFVGRSEAEFLDALAAASGIPYFPIREMDYRLSGSDDGRAPFVVNGTIDLDELKYGITVEDLLQIGMNVEEQ